MSDKVVCGFAVRKDYEGEKVFDTTYRSVELKKKLVPLGPADESGEIPYTEELVEIVTETPIRDVIDQQAESCGLEAYLRPYRLAGTEPPAAVVSGDVQDFTVFDNDIDLRASGTVEALFNQLPEDLRAQYGSPESLLQHMTEEALADYISKKIEELQKTEPKKEGE